MVETEDGAGGGKLVIPFGMGTPGTDLSDQLSIWVIFQGGVDASALRFACPSSVPGGEIRTCCSLQDLLPMGRILHLSQYPASPGWSKEGLNDVSFTSWVSCISAECRVQRRGGKGTASSAR